MEVNNLFKKTYIKANNIKVNLDLDINDSIDVNYIDILRNKTIEKEVLQSVTCVCHDPKYYKEYYDKCPKCEGNGEVLISNNTLICNHCHGSKSVVKHHCSICDNIGSYLSRKKINVPLNESIKDKDIITLDGLGKKEKGNFGNLNLTINIIDLEHYQIKDNDLYYKRIIPYTQKEVANRVSKQVETPKGFRKINVDDKDEYQVIRLEDSGINGGDFYVVVKKELPPIRGNDVYANVILKEGLYKFYLKKEDLYDVDKPLKEVHYFKPLNDPNYLYLDLDNLTSYQVIKINNKGEKGRHGGSNGDLYLKVFIGDKFLVNNNNLYDLNIEFSDSELNLGKKILSLYNEKVTFSFPKELKEFSFVKVGSLGLIKNKLENKDLFALIKPGNKYLYKISVMTNKSKGTIFITDYHHFFNEMVEAYTSSVNLDNYLTLDFKGLKKSRVYHLNDQYGNDVVITLIKGSDING